MSPRAAGQLEQRSLPVCLFGTGGSYLEPWPPNAAWAPEPAAAVAIAAEECGRRLRGRALEALGLLPLVVLGPEGLDGLAEELLEAKETADAQGWSTSRITGHAPGRYAAATGDPALYPGLPERERLFADDAGDRRRCWA